MLRKMFLVLFALVWAFTLGASAKDLSRQPEQVVLDWYKLVLELVRHTPTYSPPVASRSFAYLGITAYEAAASADPANRSLASQLTGLTALPLREKGKTYDEALVLDAALASAVEDHFGNTGPTGQRTMKRMAEKMTTRLSKGVPRAVRQRSVAYGQAVAAHILEWSKGDGGAVVENMGFPMTYELTPGPARWVPTSAIRQQQAPLLPNWGKNRTFAMPKGDSCQLPPPPAYSEDKGSQFYREAMEVVDASKDLTGEHKVIARFWSDDPMLSPTPPGHWIAIALQIFERDKTKALKQTDVLARLGVAIADGFIGCWQSKFAYDLVRPVTYIKRVINPKWETLLITPPFPEYPSGHSSQSGAAAVVLAKALGENLAFDDATHVRDGIPPRHFASFWAAAEEAAISRLYGGIHFRAAIERGLEQGRCIGAYTNALVTVN